MTHFNPYLYFMTWWVKFLSTQAEIFVWMWVYVWVYAWVCLFVCLNVCASVCSPRFEFKAGGGKCTKVFLKIKIYCIAKYNT